MKKRIICLGLSIICAAPLGCNWLVPFIFIGEHKRSVPAEFDKLAGKRVLVLVWAESATLFDYPHVRYELASYVGDKIRASVKDCDVVDPRKVEDALQRTLEVAADPREIGRQFEADMVLYMELTLFQIRDQDAPDLLKGKVSAALTVYDLNADADETGEYVLDPVDTTYPDSQPIMMSAQNHMIVRREVYARFSETVARKFHEHKVDL
jgi:hypothetical protein